MELNNPKAHLHENEIGWNIFLPFLPEIPEIGISPSFC
jgi:hypothetical protein